MIYDVPIISPWRNPPGRCPKIPRSSVWRFDMAHGALRFPAHRAVSWGDVLSIGWSIENLCIYIYIYVCVHIKIYVHKTYVYIYIYTYIYIYVHVHVNTYWHCTAFSRFIFLRVAQRVRSLVTGARPPATSISTRHIFDAPPSFGGAWGRWRVRKLGPSWPAHSFHVVSVLCTFHDTALHSAALSFCGLRSESDL